MNINRKKKKSQNFLTKQFYIDNQGDVFCCILMAIMGLQMFSLTKPYFQPFLTLNHAHNDSDSLSLFDKKFYFGFKDFFTFFSSIILWCTILSALEEYITDKFIPRMRLSLTRAYEVRISIFVLFYSLYIVFHKFYAFYHQKNFGAIFRPNFFLSFHTKCVLILSFGYFIGQIIKMRVSKTSAKNGSQYVIQWLTNFLCLVILCQFKFYELAVFGILVRSITWVFEFFGVLLGTASFFGFLKKYSPKFLFLVHFISFGVITAFSPLFFKTNKEYLVISKQLNFIVASVVIGINWLYYLYLVYGSFMAIPKSVHPPNSLKKIVKTSTPIQTQTGSKKKQH